MGAAYYDQSTFETLAQAGIAPGAALLKIAARMASAPGSPALLQGIRGLLNIVDRQDALTRFAYANEYHGLDAEMIERILYYRGEAMLFKFGEKHYCLPYALVDGVDEVGRYKGVTPLIFAGSGGTEKDAPWLNGVVFRPVYDVPVLSDFADKSAEEIETFMRTSCVLIHDYSCGIAQQNIGRSRLHDPLLDVMATMIPYARTALMNSTGVMGIPVDAGQETSVFNASAGVDLAALEGRRYVPILRGTMPEMQELAGGNVAKAEEFFLAMQALDNFRLGLYGIQNGGIFQKKAHELQAEAELNGGAVGLAQEDSLRQRQKALLIYNTIHGGSMWVEPSEAAMGADRDGDLVQGSDGPAANEVKEGGGADD
jgi:hypothetical protein